MKQWNGWGDDQNDLGLELKSSALGFLQQLIGMSKPLPDATLEQVVAKVPASRLPAHELVSLDPEDRLRHARGQSLPDWLAMRSGDFNVFPTAWPFPALTQRYKRCCSMRGKTRLTSFPMEAAPP